ncbi:MAG: hypothetical protein SGPRY_006934, partial [Prymnesium sp.]
GVAQFNAICEAAELFPAHLREQWLSPTARPTYCLLLLSSRKTHAVHAGLLFRLIRANGECSWSSPREARELDPSFPARVMYTPDRLLLLDVLLLAVGEKYRHVKGANTGGHGKLINTATTIILREEVARASFSVARAIKLARSTHTATEWYERRGYVRETKEARLLVTMLSKW